MAQRLRPSSVSKDDALGQSTLVLRYILLDGKHRLRKTLQVRFAGRQTLRERCACRRFLGQFSSHPDLRGLKVTGDGRGRHFTAAFSAMALGSSRSGVTLCGPVF